MGALANLDHNANFTAVDVVNPGQTGTYGGQYGASLVNPDYLMYAPRIGLAWSPKYKWTKSMVIRGGYGINYNTGQYATFAQKLSRQAPVLGNAEQFRGSADYGESIAHRDRMQHHAVSL